LFPLRRKDKQKILNNQEKREKIKPRCLSTVVVILVKVKMVK